MSSVKPNFHEKNNNKPLIKIKRYTYDVGNKQAVVVAYYNKNQGKPLADILTNLMITDIGKHDDKH